MMQSGDIVLLKRNSLNIVLLCLFELSNFIPAKCPIIEGLKMRLIELDCTRVILDSTHVLSLFAICKTSIVIEVSFCALKLDGFRETLNSLIKVTFPI